MDSRFVHFAPAATPATTVAVDPVRRRPVATRSIATFQIGRSDSARSLQSLAIASDVIFD
ncbi:hypothetical protein R6Q59_036100 [Mikania micrantha]